jgi:predicted peptidase
MRCKRELLVWLVLIAICPNNTMLAANVADFVDYSLRDSGGNLLLPGRLYVPPEAAICFTDPRPLIVYLHGSNDNGLNNVAQIGTTIDNLLAETKRRGVFLYAPQTASNWNGRAITDQVMEMIDRALIEQNADPRRLYVTGFSNGGGGTWNLLSRYDQRFAAAIPVSGVIPAPDFAPANLIDTPIWTFHARNDGTVPAGVTRNIVSSIFDNAGEPTPTFPPAGSTSDFFLFNNRLDLSYNELGTAGHNIWFGVSRIPRIYDWLFAHTLAVPEPGTAVAATTVLLLILNLRLRRTRYPELIIVGCRVKSRNGRF